VETAFIAIVPSITLEPANTVVLSLVLVPLPKGVPNVTLALAL
jgi:hypothetical protein